MNTKYLYQTYNFYHGPGHGWLEVPKVVVDHLKVTPSKYSYYDPVHKLVYLEEDCDATAFDHAWQLKLKTELKVKAVRVDCENFIRRLGRCA